MDFASAAFLAIATLLICFSLRFHISQLLSKHPLPPGPTVFSASIPKRDVWYTIQEWHERYGPIISLKLGVQIIIILGSREVAQDLFDKRGSIYSSRPKSIFISKYLSKGLQPGLMPYGPEFLRHRRLHQHLLSSRAAQAYRAIQEVESLELTYDMLSTDDFKLSIRRFALSVVFTLAYAKPLTKSDLELEEIKHIDDIFGKMERHSREIPF